MTSFVLSDILRVASYRISEAISYFSSQSKNCTSPAEKKYLLYVTLKKMKQQLVLNQIIKNSHTGNVNFNYHDFSGYSLILKNPQLLSNLSLRDIHTFTCQHSIEELEFYLSIEMHAGDQNSKHTLNTLVDLSRNFLSTITKGYQDTIAKSPSYRVYTLVNSKPAKKIAAI